MADIKRRVGPQGPLFTNPTLAKGEAKPLVTGRAAPPRASRQRPRAPTLPPISEHPEIRKSSEQTRAALAQLNPGGMQDMVRLGLGLSAETTVVRYTASASPGSDGNVELAAGALNLDANAAGASAAVHDTKVAADRGGAQALQSFNLGDSAGDVKMRHDLTGSSVAFGGNLAERGDSTFSARGFGLYAGGLSALGVSVGWNSAAGMSGAVSAVGAMHATTRIKALHGRDAGVGEVLTEWKSSVAPLAVIGVSGAASGIGLGTRLGAARKKEIIYNTFIDRERVGALLRRRAQKRDYPRRIAQALGLSKADIQAPKLADMQADGFSGLRPGESLRFLTSKTFSMGLSGGSHGVRAGTQGAYTGESEFMVRRLSEHVVEVMVTPRTVLSVSANLDFLLIAEAGATKSLARGLAQGFTFDLSQPAARDALAEMLDGKPPAIKLKPSKVNAGDAVAMANAHRDETFVPGVKRSFVEKVERSERRVEGGVPRPAFVRGNIAGLGPARGRFKERSVLSQGDGALQMKTVGSKRDKQLFLRGTKSSVVSGSVRGLVTFDEDGGASKKFDGLVLQADLSQDRSVKSMRNQMTEKLRRSFAVSIDDFALAGQGQTYVVKLQRVLSASDLTKLSAATPQMIHQAALRSGAKAHALQALVAQLDAGKDGVKDATTVTRAAQVSRYIANERLAGFGAIHALLDGDVKALAVEVQSSAYDKPVDKALNLMLKYETVTDQRLVAAGVREAESIDKQLGMAVKNLRDDAMLRAFDPDGQQTRLSRLTELKTSVQDFRTMLQGRLKR